LSKAHQSQEPAARYFGAQVIARMWGMTQVEDKDYYSVRADQARQHAEAAASEKIKSIHLDMAERYAALAGSKDSSRPTLRIRAA
jgi:hypothetical protein